MKKILSISLLVLILSSCIKKPEAQFRFNQDGYIQGDVVKLTNTSKNAVKYKWVLPDGSIVTDKDAEYIIPINCNGVNTSVKLTVFSKNNLYSDTYEDSFMASQQVGHVTFWKSTSCGCGNITVSFSIPCYPYTQSALLYTDFTSAPPPFTSGANTFVEYGGTYNYTATDGVKTWNGNFTITTNSELYIQLN